MLAATQPVRTRGPTQSFAAPARKADFFDEYRCARRVPAGVHLWSRAVWHGNVNARNLASIRADPPTFNTQK